MLRLRPNARPVPDGSRTITIHDSAPRELHPADPSSEDDSNATPSPVVDNDEPDRQAAPRLVLNLQGGPKPKAVKRVVWKEDVVDNEGCGKKKSKICCIYHKPRRFDESSDESSDSDNDGGHSRRRNHNHDHDHDHDHNGHSDGGNDNNAGTSSSDGNATASTSTTTTATTPSAFEPNAYEYQPHHRRPNPTSN